MARRRARRSRRAEASGLGSRANAARVAVGKLLNAGQTCIAPDYALVPERMVDAFVAAVTRAVRALYPDPLSGDDYTSIVNERHYDRLVALIEDARAKGAKVVTIPDGAAPDPATRRIPPTLLVGATDAMQVMREEIFGPILPVESYARLDDAIAAVTRRPRPLAFYVFAEDRVVRERLLRETIAGLLPPSSSVTGVRFSAAAIATMRPTAVEPVKKRWSNGSRVNSAPVLASPMTTVNSSGAKRCAIASASSADVAGVTSDGFSITRLPAASAPIAGASASCTG